LSAAAAAAAGGMDSRGFDSAGRIFTNASEMWVEEIGSTVTATATATTSAAAEAEAAATAAAAGNGGAGEEASGEGKRKEWYSKAIAYWQVKHPLFLLPETLNPPSQGVLIADDLA